MTARRLGTDEIDAIAAALGAGSCLDTATIAEAQAIESSLVDAMAALLVAVIGREPFERRNGAVAIAAVDVLARLNRWRLDLEPPEDAVAMVSAVRAGLSPVEVRAWLAPRLTRPSGPVGPRCPACAMPLREALDVQPVAGVLVASCGGCGHLFVQPFRRRPLLEV